MFNLEGHKQYYNVSWFSGVSDAERYWKSPEILVCYRSGIPATLIWWPFCPTRKTWVTWYQNVSILDFIGAKDDGDGGDNWSYKTCKAAISYNIPTSSFLQVRCPCVIQLSMSEQRKNIKFHRLAYQAYLGSTSLVFAHQRLLVTLGECCELSCQPFSTSTLCTMEA